MLSVATSPYGGKSASLTRLVVVLQVGRDPATDAAVCALLSVQLNVHARLWIVLRDNPFIYLRLHSRSKSQRESRGTLDVQTAAQDGRQTYSVFKRFKTKTAIREDRRSKT